MHWVVIEVNKIKRPITKKYVDYNQKFRQVSVSLCEQKQASKIIKQLPEQRKIKFTGLA